MSFGKFGARPRGMTNPTYWVSRHLQDQRRQAAKINSDNKFNEKWQRLNSIFDNLQENFISKLNGLQATKSENEKLHINFQSAKNLRSEISMNINSIGMAELSKYATSLKKLSLITFSLCKRLSVYDDIEEITYDSDSKTLKLNGQTVYYFG